MNQGLCGLREGVGDTVAETLPQAGPVETAGRRRAQGGRLLFLTKAGRGLAGRIPTCSGWTWTRSRCAPRSG